MVWRPANKLFQCPDCGGWGVAHHSRKRCVDCQAEHERLMDTARQRKKRQQGNKWTIAA